MKSHLRKLSGAYFTPEPIVSALSCWAVRKETDRLLDPSCGDGRFIASHQNAVGVEQDPDSARQAIERAPWALVHEGDFFQWAAATSERFECCAGNPPFVRYQNFRGEVRQRALSLCESEGVSFNGLASSWAPFLVAAASLLKRGGRMAFVVPAEIGHAPYAKPLLEYLVAQFSVVHIVAIREKLFPELSEDCWLLYAEGFGDRSASIRFTALDRFIWSARPPAAYTSIDLNDWRSQWASRLRPFLLPPSTRSVYARLRSDGWTASLSEFADIGIGYVSGDNDFFHLRPSEASELQIPEAFLQPTVRNGRALPVKKITRSHVKTWTQSDDKFLLLRLKSDDEIPWQVRLYLDSEAGHAARQGYKCRMRSPWYSVPDVRIPDLMLSYMSGRSPQLIRNEAGVTCTNSLHAVRIRDQRLAEKFLLGWDTDLRQLSCEIEGHPLGGGMLKLEVREAAKVRLADPARKLEKSARLAIQEGVVEMRRWRHYASENM